MKAERIDLNTIEVIRSRRRTVSLQIKPDLSIYVRAPLTMPERDIRKFVNSKRDWVEKNLSRMAKVKAERELRPQDTPERIEELMNQAREVIPERVRFYAPIVGVSYGRITIRNQKTRWGSCSAKGNLNFNCHLMDAPPEVLDYVVVHELCHRLEMNHSAKFWAEVARVCPWYKEARAWLRRR